MTTLNVKTWQIPPDLLQATRMTAEEIKIELALHLFEREKLSFGKARELAGLDIWQFMQLLGSRNISIHYDVAEYEEDLATLRKMARL